MNTNSIMAGKEQSIHELALEGDSKEVMRRVQEKTTLLTKTDDSGRIPLHWAVSKGHLELTSWLLNQQKSAVNEKDDSGWTPLIIAASAGHAEIVELLLSNGAEVGAVTAQGRSSLLYAASKNREDVIRRLLTAGAKVNSQDELGATPLHRAAGPGNLAAVTALLAADAALVDVKDKYGNTALHYACEEERTEVARLLLKAGASTEVENREEKTPLQVCSPCFARSIKAN